MSAPQSSAISLELFGMPRVIAGTDRITVTGHHLRSILDRAVAEYPELGRHVLSADGDWLNSGYTFVVDGTFTCNPEQPVEPGSEVFLVSRASGG